MTYRVPSLVLLVLIVLAPHATHAQSILSPAKRADTILLTVPFIAQAPLGHWSDPRQEDGCEEASVLMAVAWVRGKTFTKQTAEQELITISNTEQRLYSSYINTSLTDTVQRLFKTYYSFENAKTRFSISTQDIVKELQQGNLVLVQVYGRRLKNPFFTPPGPIEHMLVIKGYDNKTKEFITNDPGTRHGESYRYPESIMQNAIYLYPTTGKKIDLLQRTGMIIVSKKK